VANPAALEESFIGTDPCLLTVVMSALSLQVVVAYMAACGCGLPGTMCCSVSSRQIVPGRLGSAHLLKEGSQTLTQTRKIPIMTGVIV
jgi:hypothetical protein